MNEEWKTQHANDSWPAVEHPLHLTIIGILLIAALALTLTMHMMLDPRYCPPGYELQERWIAEPGELYAEAVCTIQP